MELNWEQTEQISKLYAIDPRLAEEYKSGIELYMMEKKLLELERKVLERKAYEDKRDMYAPITCPPPQLNIKPYGYNSSVFSGIAEEPKKENPEAKVMRDRALLMEEINNVKYCRDCRFSKRMGWWNFDTRLRCNHPLMVELCSGKPKVLCNEERRTHNRKGPMEGENRCGMEGWLYEEDV